MKAGIFCIAKISAFLFSYEEVLKRGVLFVNTDDSPFLFAEINFGTKKSPRMR